MPESSPKYASLPPWLRWLLLKLSPPSQIYHLDDIDGYPHNDAILLKAFLARDLNQLDMFRRLGIPVPEMLRPMTIIKSQDNTLRPYSPEFGLPYHFFFYARLPLPPGVSPFTTEPEIAVYFFAGEEDTVYEAEAMLHEKGLLEVARKFPGKWYNRDPYWALKPEGEIRIGLSSPTQAISVPVFLNLIKEKGPPLEEVLGYPLPELELMQRRLDLYQGFAALTRPPTLAGLLEYDKGKRRLPEVPDSILFGLPMPQPAFGPNTVSLKIMPSGDAPAGLMQSLLMSLRAAGHPIAFEIIDDGSSAYMQMSCHADDVSLLARQLRLHFPNFSIQKNDETIDDELFGVTIKQAAPYQMVRTMSEFPIDPLGQLFAILDESPHQCVTAFQVLFFPLPDAAILQVTDHLQETADRQADPNLSARIRQGVQKLPAWQATVRLLCGWPATLTKLKASFLGQYQAAGQIFTFSREYTTITKRDMNAWMLLSTPELAAFAHFPTSESLV